MKLKLSKLTTPQLQVYAELTTAQLDELDKYGMDTTICHSFGGIDELDKKKIHDNISIKMIKIEETRISLVKEINRRMRRDLETSFGPSDVQPYLNKFQTEFPLIGKSEIEVKQWLKKKETEKSSNLAKA
jgi:hypothetical protein